MDLFAGCGGTALGVEEACRAVGLATSVPFAIDNSAAACAVFRDNFPSANLHQGDVGDFFEADLDAPLNSVEIELAKKAGKVDLVIGGPPCQGHSDLNNYSRRADPKNALYSTLARAAKVFRPRHVIIENVQGTPHDRAGIFQTTVNNLIGQGYHVEFGLVDLSRLGVPQTRRRHIVVASLEFAPPSIPKIVQENEVTERRDVRWAIGDLLKTASTKLVDQPSKPSKDNVRRIEYLFNNGLYDLPNSERPPCHRDRKQTYNSVYGRLKWDLPSQTITSGFYSMCMGRYVHPEKYRTLTAHEAARLQCFPDFFSFEAAGSRTAIATLIGNAVPMKLSYAIVRSLLNIQKIEREPVQKVDKL
ncbi:DNA cytosine methyltransferase [Agrobacterium tumefaciens]|nr:DNA cytosine methyltransferase [Agrobacterium tumefaciens]